MDATEHRPDEVTVTELRDHLSGTVDAVFHEGRRIYLTRSGRRVAAVVPVDEAELLDEAEDAYFARRAEEALAAQGDRPFKPYAQVLADLEAAERGEATA